MSRKHYKTSDELHDERRKTQEEIEAQEKKKENRFHLGVAIITLVLVIAFVRDRIDVVNRVELPATIIDYKYNQFGVVIIGNKYGPNGGTIDYDEKRVVLKYYYNDNEYINDVRSNFVSRINGPIGTGVTIYCNKDNPNDIRTTKHKHPILHVLNIVGCVIMFLLLMIIH